MNRTRISSGHNELRAIGRETHPGGMVALRIFEFSHGATGSDFFEMDEARRQFQRHQFAVRRERDVSWIQPNFSRQPATYFQGVQLVKGEFLFARDNQFAIVWSEENV